MGATDGFRGSPAHEKLRRELRAVGFVPRVFSGTILVGFSALLISTVDDWLLISSLLLPFAFGFVLSLRVCASEVDDILVIQGYLRKYTFKLDEIELAVIDEYVGLWSTGASATWVGLVQLELVGKVGKPSKELPATLCFIRNAKRITSSLNAAIEELESG